MTELRLLTVGQLADILQVRVSWVYRRTSEGSIPVIRVGRYLRFRAEDVLKWLGEEYGSSPIEGWFLPGGTDYEEGEDQ